MTATAASDRDSIELAGFDPLIARRRTNRRRFSTNTIPTDLLAVLQDAARDCGAALIDLRQPDDRVTVGRLSQLADQRQILDPGYRAELRRWSGTRADRNEGVPAQAVPHFDAGSHADEATALPIRDFDTAGTGYLPVDTGSTTDQCLLLLGTYTDTPLSWIHAGEALEHVLLLITRHDYAASPLTQIVEDPDTRDQLQTLLRDRLRQTMTPHVLLRVGQAPPSPATGRRPISDVVTELG
jgi:hypothetical protein